MPPTGRNDMRLLPFYPGCHMQARTEIFASKEGYLITIGEDPTDKDTRWAKYLYEHLKKACK